jgi:hypothetical protein
MRPTSAVRAVFAIFVSVSTASGCGGETHGQPPVDASRTDTDAVSTMDASSEASPDASTDASTGSPDARAEASNDPCIINASDFDQSCIQDTDCVEVTSGDYCVLRCLCGLDTINQAALVQFNEAVGNTPLGSGRLGTAPGCPCVVLPGPCCRHGTCTYDCESTDDTLPACADAGGTCALVFPGGSCFKNGPPNSCAYSDEKCCL